MKKMQGVGSSDIRLLSLYALPSSLPPRASPLTPIPSKLGMEGSGVRLPPSLVGEGAGGRGLYSLNLSPQHLSIHWYCFSSEGECWACQRRVVCKSSGMYCWTTKWPGKSWLYL